MKPEPQLAPDKKHCPICAKDLRYLNLGFVAREKMVAIFIAKVAFETKSHKADGR